MAKAVDIENHMSQLNELVLNVCNMNMTVMAEVDNDFGCNKQSLD